nr:unnamed protein product [Digitaria exilis]
MGWEEELGKASCSKLREENVVEVEQLTGVELAILRRSSSEVMWWSNLGVSSQAREGEQKWRVRWRKGRAAAQLPLG